MRTSFHYPESPNGRTYADVITKISRIDSSRNYLSYGATLARARSSAMRESMGGDFFQGGRGVTLNIIIMCGGWVEINFCLMRGGHDLVLGHI